MNERIVLKSGKNIGDYQINNNLEYKPCAICNKIDVEMSEFLIGFFLEGTNHPVCLECAKQNNPVLFYLWEMGIFTEVPSEFRRSKMNFQRSYESLRKKK